MALSELHDGKGIPKEWFTDQAVREAKWLLPIARRIGQALDLTRRADSAPFMDGTTFGDACRDAWDEMEKKEANPGFLTSSELAEWVHDVREAAFEVEGWTKIEDFAEKLPVLLLRPLDQFDFEVAGALADKVQSHGFQYLENLELGGPCRVSLVPIQKDDRFRGVAIRGAVRAATPSGVATRAEAIVDEVCGALRALGMACFVPLPGRGFNGLFGTVDLPAVTVTGQKWFEHPVDLDPAYVLRLPRLVLTIPTELGDIQRQQVARGDLDGALGLQHRLLRKVIGGASSRAEEVRSGSRRLVQAELASDFGVAVTLAFSAVEGLLLDPSHKEGTVGRLTEAVAHGLGTSADERKALRKQVKALYDKRSDFAHTGSARQKASEREEAIALGYRVLRREMELLGDAPVDIAQRTE